MSKHERRIARQLKRLGKTSQTVAASLGREGISGYIAAACECPVAVYLSRENPTLSDFFVDVDGVTWTEHATGLNRFRNTAQSSAEVPKAICDFIKDFDRREYPWLVKVED